MASEVFNKVIYPPQAQAQDARKAQRFVQSQLARDRAMRMERGQWYPDPPDQHATMVSGRFVNTRV